MKGLPQNATEADIITFFKGFNIIEGGIKRAMVGGKPSSECFIILKTKEEAARAMSLNMEKIGNRFIELFISNEREF